MSEQSKDAAFLKRLVAAWEALPGGKQQPVSAVERWLIEDMAPVINEARAALASREG